MTRNHIIARPTVRILAGDVSKLITDELDDKQKQWCEAVVKNNAPGQKVSADEEMLEACEKASGKEVFRLDGKKPKRAEKESE